MRLYIPATASLVEQLIETGAIDVTRAFAITPALREWYQSDDDEELEYVASIAAARASLEMLSNDANTPRRRVVLAIDVPAISPVDSSDRAEVQAPSTLKVEQVQAALVDSIEAEADISAALAVWERRDEDAHFAREQAHSHELQWFAADELGFIF